MKGAKLELISSLIGSPGIFLPRLLQRFGRTAPWLGAVHMSARAADLTIKMFVVTHPQTLQPVTGGAFDIQHL